jgi:hypothetical protein
MKKPTLISSAAATMIVVAFLLFAYGRWHGSDSNPAIELLQRMPPDASSVLYVDVKALRQSPFLAELYKWIPPAAADADYTQFVRSTGFNYETDLDHLGLALIKRGQETTMFALAEGRFEHRKIAAYAQQTGVRQSRNGREIFSVPISGEARRITFAFLGNGRLALTNGAELDEAFAAPPSDSDAQAWREHFRRLAGSPIFSVIRQDAIAASPFPNQLPSYQSPQLAALLEQLQWITLAGKPDEDRMRVVLEGEGSPQTNTRQLSELLNGLLLFAQAGLSDPKVRQQLQPQVREAYLEVLKSVDVSQLDRGETKSVRVIFQITPSFLEAARAAIPAGNSAPSSNKSTIRN